MTWANEEGYVFRHRYPEREDIYRSFARASEEARAVLSCTGNIAYGDHPREQFDLFHGWRTGPLLIFIHGGYWRSFSKESFSFVARPFVEKGCTVAVIGYPLLPDVVFARLCDSVRQCVPAVHKAIRDMGHRPPYGIVSGHSAGGHLAALLAATGWSVPGIPLRGCLAISGIFDLEPLLETSLGEMLGLSRQEAAALSPLRIGRRNGRLLAAVGASETLAFQEQSRAYVRHWAALGGTARLVQLSGRHHYDILCDLMLNRSELVDHLQQFIAQDRTAAAHGRS